MGPHERRQGWDGRRFGIEALEDRRMLAMDFHLVGDFGIDPDYRETVGNDVFFTTRSGNNLSLWKTDGSNGGTALLKSFTASGNSESLLTNVEGTLYFVVPVDFNQHQLWKSDGTASGTLMVANPASISRPDSLTNVGGTLFFTANSGATGAELWRSDGTVVGTTMVKDILPGSGSSGVAGMTALGSVAFFEATDGTGSRQLWRSDGTTTGTFKLADGTSTQVLKTASGFVPLGGFMFFVGGISGSGAELWKSDGTAAGTAPVKDLNPTGTAALGNLTRVGNLLYFTTGTTLWKSDGSDAGTTPVKTFSSGSFGNNSLGVGSTLYFWLSTSTTGVELWTSDGTSDGTTMVKDIHPGATGQPFYTPLFAANSRVYFPATDPAGGTEVWSSMGTAVGTVREFDFVPGSRGSNPDILGIVNGTLIVAATTDEFGRELWAAPLLPLVGDYDANQRVDGADFLTWQRQYDLAANPPGSGADGDRNGIVGGLDLAVWKTNYGATGLVAAGGVASAPAKVGAMTADDETSAIKRAERNYRGVADHGVADAAFAWLAADRTATARGSWKRSTEAEVEMLARDHVARSLLVPPAGTELGEPVGIVATVRRIRGSEASLGTDDAIAEGEDALTAELCGLTAGSAFPGRDALMKTI